MERNSLWHTVAVAALRRILPVVVIAVLGALTDAGLLDGAIGDLARAQPASSFKSSVEQVVSPPPLQHWG